MAECKKCMGCGRLADSEDGEPWKLWEDLPPGSDIAVQMGLVKPVLCPDCGGTGDTDKPGITPTMKLEQNKIVAKIIKLVLTLDNFIIKEQINELSQASNIEPILHPQDWIENRQVTEQTYHVLLAVSDLYLVIKEAKDANDSSPVHRRSPFGR